MGKNKTERQILSRVIVGGLRETIRAHGPITKRLIGSAVKRIVGILLTKEKVNESLHTDAK